MAGRKFGKKNVIKVDPLAYNLGLIGESGIGKEQPISEPVLLEHGWTNMGDIKIGDKIYGQDGKLHNVIGVYPQGIKDVYELTFSDGTKTRCGLEHLWHVHTKKQREAMRNNNDYRYQVKSLKELMTDYKNENKNSYKYSVPINSEIVFTKEKLLPLDPYVLGLLLGDGGFTGNVTTFTNPEKELFEQLEQRLEKLKLKLHCRNFENHQQATIIKDDNNDESFNILNTILINLKLFGCDSRRKFIPKDYIYSSITNRIELLSGIINTDGHVHKGVSIQICSYSEQLAKDIAELARSLGYIATFQFWDRTDNNSTKKYEKEIEYRVTIIGDYSKLTLSTKHSNKLTSRCYNYCKSITDIRLIGQEESQCIMIDNPQHLYITNNYIVTHNTTLAKEVCEKLVGDDGYMIFNIGKEDGIDAIAGAIYEDIPDWDTFEEVTDDILENKLTDYKDLKVIIYDTLDELFEIAEPEVIRLHNRENPEKPVKSIKAAFGGYMAGEDKAAELILTRIWELKKIGVSMFIVGHTKKRTMTDVATGLEYDMLTTNMSHRYFNALKTKLHVLGVASINREITQTKTGKKVGKGKDRKDEIKGSIENETRLITFRDDNFNIDSKSRFSEIVESINLSPDEFIKAIEDAIKIEHDKQSGNKSIEETKAEQSIEKDKIIEQNANDKKAEFETKEVERLVGIITDFVKTNKTNPQVLKPLLQKSKELGYINPTKVDNLKDANILFDLINVIH